MIERIVDAAASDMAGNMDNEIRRALNAFWPVWTMDDVRRRCEIVIVAGSPVETLCADGVPLLEMYPLESTTDRRDDSFVVTYTRKFRQLRSAPNTNPVP